MPDKFDIFIRRMTGPPAWGGAVPQAGRATAVRAPADDLDFAPVVNAAFEVRDRLKAVGLESWLKTTGGPAFAHDMNLGAVAVELYLCSQSGPVGGESAASASIGRKWLRSMLLDGVQTIYGNCLGPTHRRGSTSVHHPVTIHTDGEEHLDKAADSEKITINLGFVDLGQIDLLVQEGFFSNRTDFIRTAIRNQLDRRSEIIQKSVKRTGVELGLRHFSRSDLEQVRADGTMLEVHVLGLASFASDITPELALATIRSLKVLGALHASAAVKAALAHRIR